MHIHCCPSVVGRSASLSAGLRRNNIHSINWNDNFRDGGYSVLFGKSGRGSLCGHGKSDEDAILNLCIRLKDIDNDYSEKYRPILFLVCWDNPKNKVRIPNIKIEDATIIIE
ncbi:hypothetical protein H6776_01995 [Candidatus Nomurabacteria bacterium]|nr:hypothetical protein [Candidatus Nomurabacteria bacterium]